MKQFKLCAFLLLKQSTICQVTNTNTNTKMAFKKYILYWNKKTVHSKLFQKTKMNIQMTKKQKLYFRPPKLSKKSIIKKPISINKKIHIKDPHKSLFSIIYFQ
jgi:hypothetical protein